MDPLSVTASIVAILQLTHDVTRYLSDVVNAPKQCQQCVEEASGLLGPLTSLKYRAEKANDDDVWYEQLRLLNVEGGPLKQYEQALKLLQSRTQVEDGMQKIKRRLLWTFTKDEVTSILSRIERLKSLVSVALEMDHFKLSEAIKNDVDALQKSILPLQTSVKAIEAGVDTLQLDTRSVKDDTGSIRAAVPALQATTSNIMATQLAQRLQDALQWLSRTDYPAQQHDIICRRQDGTAQWFLDSGEFKKWTNGDDKNIFCPGIPGAGKTMMAAVGIDHLHRAMRSDDSIGIAYVFCSYLADLEQSAPNLLAALLKQLVQGRPDLANPVMDMYDDSHGKKLPPSELYEALKSVCSTYKTVYLLVDALDEFSDRDGARTHFLDRLSQLQGSADVRILFTSRFLPAIVDRFRSILTLEVRASEQDVKLYVEGQLSRLPACVQRSEDLQRMIVSKVTEAADGMFLLARLHVESLYDKRNRARVLATLEKISQRSGDLDVAYSKAYDEALKRIDSQSPDDRSLAKRALCWVSLAYRQLSTPELCHGLAIEPGDKCLNPDNVYDIEDIISVCAGLMTVDDGTNVVRLVHYTTQEYFERVRMEWNPEAKVDITTACLTCLCFDAFQSGSCDDYEAFEDRITGNVFFDYSAVSWSHHVKQVQSSYISKLALNFLCSASLVDSAVEVAWTLGSLDGFAFPSRTNGLHLTARHGLDALASLLLEDGRLGLQIENSEGQTPLLLAARYGHDAVVKVLLATNRVNVNFRDSAGRTPLSWAAYNGHHAVVRLLLATDVEVDARDSKGQTALILAAECGYVAVVNLLLATGQGLVEIWDYYEKTPLLWAAENGHEEVVRRLLASGRIKANLKNHHGRTLLSQYAGYGHEIVVRILLTMDGVEVDSKDIFGDTPLSWAAQEGHEAVVRLLLASDKVDVDVKSVSGMTPLFWAVEQEHVEIAKLLLATSKVDVDALNDRGQTPRSWAARWGSEAMVNLLGGYQSGLPSSHSATSA